MTFPNTRLNSEDITTLSDAIAAANATALGVNAQVTLLASAARTASVNSDAQTNLAGRGVQMVVDITDVPGAAVDLVVKIQGQDPVSEKWYELLESASLAATGTTVLKVYPGLTAAANTVASDILPYSWRVSVTAGNANEATYSVGANVVK